MHLQKTELSWMKKGQKQLIFRIATPGCMIKLGLPEPVLPRD